MIASLTWSLNSVLTEGKSVLQDVSDDDGEPNTYDYNDSFINDEGVSSEDDYSPSDDENWMPNASESEEDVNELLEEAKDFTSNPKMQKR